MLEIVNTVSTYDARYTLTDFNYDVNFVITNGEITSVQCTAYQKGAENFDPLGYVRKEAGRVSSDFPAGVSLVEHVETFEKIVSEIEGAMNPDVKVEGD